MTTITHTEAKVEKVTLGEAAATIAKEAAYLREQYGDSVRFEIEDGILGIYVYAAIIDEVVERS